MPGRLEFGVAPASSGEMLEATTIERALPPGDTVVETTLKVANLRLWELNDPAMYRVTARVSAEGSDSIDERSTRCGFRELAAAMGLFYIGAGP